MSGVNNTSRASGHHFNASTARQIMSRNIQHGKRCSPEFQADYLAKTLDPMKTSSLLVTVAASQATETCMLKTTIMFKEADTVIFWTRTISAIFAFAEDVDLSSASQGCEPDWICQCMATLIHPVKKVLLELVVANCILLVNVPVRSG